MITHLTPIKNANYQQSVEYLTQQHDEIKNSRGKIVKYEAIYDENGLLKERENYAINYLKSDGQEGNLKDWNRDCVETNVKFKKNLEANDQKAHHYIISYPEEDVKKGLTVEKAQRAAEEFCRKNFPGHQALVATHSDTDNIHTHIVINSVRDREVEPEKWMTKGTNGQIKPSQYEAGGKHTNTAYLREHLMREIDSMCKEKGFTVENYSDESKRRKDFIRDGKLNDGKHFAVTEAQKRIEYMHDSVIEAAKSSKNFSEFQKKLEEEYRLKIYIRGSSSISVVHPDMRQSKNLQSLGLTPLDLTSDMHKHYHKAPHSYEGVYDKWDNPDTRFERHRKRENDPEEGQLKLEKDECSRKGWNNSQTFRSYSVSRFNEDGQPKTLMESIFELAYVVINGEMPEHGKTQRQQAAEAKYNKRQAENKQSEYEKLIYSPREQKLENLNYAMQIAKEMHISTPEQLTEKLQSKDLDPYEKAKTEFVKEQYELASDKEYCYSKIFKKRQKELKKYSREAIDAAKRQLEEMHKKNEKHKKPKQKEIEEYQREVSVSMKAVDFIREYEAREINRGKDIGGPTR